MGLLKNLGTKAMELMEEDTVYSASKSEDDASFELLLKASDKNYIAYVSAYVRLLEKRKYPGGGFKKGISETISDRPKDVQKKVRDILKQVGIYV